MEARKPLPLLLALWLVLSAGTVLATQSPAAATAPPASQSSAPAPLAVGPKDRVLDFGVQPLWVPTSTITEAMKRDRVLARDLAGTGTEIRFHPFRVGPEGNRHLGPEGLDGMVAGDMPALTVAAQKDVVIVSLVHQGFAAIVAKDVGKVADLRGKKVVYAPGSSTHFTLLRVLALHGLRPEQVALVPSLEMLDWLELLRTGRVSALATWDPHTSSVLKAIPGATVLHRSLFEGYMYFTRRAVEDRPRQTRMVLAAQLRAMAWMRMSPANLNRACRWALAEHRRFGGTEAPVTVEEYAALINGSLLDVAPLPEIEDDRLAEGGEVHAKHRFLATHGAIPPDSAFSRIQASFDRRLIQEVTADPLLYHLTEFDYDSEAD